MVTTDIEADDGQPVSEIVVSAVAEACGVEPLELGQPLFETVDPEALDRVLAPRGSGVRRTDPAVAFTYCGHRVHVTQDQLSVTDLEAGLER